MSTPLTDSINALTQYANEITGKSDTTLSDAVGSLVEGYVGGSRFEVVDRFSYDEDTTNHTFTHTGVGFYVVTEEPVLTLQKAIEENRPNNSLFATSFCIYQTGSNPEVRANSSLVYLRTGKIDYWGIGISLNGDVAQIRIANTNTSIRFKAGITYVVLKWKI